MKLVVSYVSVFYIIEPASNEAKIPREREGYGSICSFLSKEENNWLGAVRLLLFDFSYLSH